MRYAELLSEYIERSGKTLDQLANDCNSQGVKVHATYISKLRSGKRDVPSEEITKALAIACGGSPDELLTAGRLEKAPTEIVELHEEYEELSGIFAILRNDLRLLNILLESQSEFSTIPDLQVALSNMTITEQLKFFTSHGLKLTLTDKSDGTTSVDFFFGEKSYDMIDLHENEKKIPLLGKIRCGIPLLDESNWDEQITTDNIYADFAARADGDSMIFAGINPGDIILFKTIAEPYTGQIVATRHVNLAEGVNLKFFVNKNGRPLLRSANPDYKDIELNGDHQIIGVMCGLIREDQPSMSDYEKFLAIKSDVDGRWTNVISLATSYGITPEMMQQMITMHVAMTSIVSGSPNLGKKQ